MFYIEVYVVALGPSEYLFYNSRKNPGNLLCALHTSRGGATLFLIEFHCDDVCLAGSLPRPCHDKLWVCTTFVTDCLASSTCCSRSLWLAIVFLQLRSWLELVKIFMKGAVPLPLVASTSRNWIGVQQWKQFDLGLIYTTPLPLTLKSLSHGIVIMEHTTLKTNYNVKKIGMQLKERSRDACHTSSGIHLRATPITESHAPWWWVSFGNEENIILIIVK